MAASPQDTVNGTGSPGFARYGLLPDAPARPPAPLRNAATVLAIAVIYFITARLGLLLAMPGGHITPVWPPSGIALAAVLLLGARAWPGIFLGSFAANARDLIGSPMDLATEIAASATFGVGASLTALLGAALVRRHAGGASPLERVRHVCLFLVLGGVVSCVVSATIGVTTLCAGGFAPWTGFAMAWLTWWLGDTAGVFVVAPLLLAWLSAPGTARRGRWPEAACSFALLLACAYLVFVPFSGMPLAFLFLPFLVWPAVRFGARGATAAVAITAALSVWYTIRGFGPFGIGTRNESLLLLELFLSIVVLTALCNSASVRERMRAEAAKRAAFDEMEDRVRERTAALAASEERLRTIIATEPECVKLLSADGSLLEMNRAGLLMIEADEFRDVENHCIYPLVAGEHRAAFRALTEKVFAGESGILEFQIIGLKGGRRWLETHAGPLRDASGKITALVGITRDITSRKQNEALLNGQKQVLELMAAGTPLAESLTALLRLLEAQSPEMHCSILLLDADGVHVRHGAAPSLPDEFNRAIDGLPIGPCAGSCGTAAFRREAVVVEDIATDPLWADYRDSALAHGLRACWSTPIFDAERRVLGTFAIYYRQPGRPGAEHLRLIEVATHIAAIAIVKARTEADLRESEEKFAKAFHNIPDAILLTTLEGRILDANAGMTRLTGYQIDEVRGRTTVELGFWTDIADRERYVAALREHGRVQEMEASFRNRRGEKRACLVSGELMELDGAQVIVGIVRNITVRRQAEAALEAERRFSDTVIDSLPGVFYLVTPERRLLRWNKNLAQITGLSHDELATMDASALFPPEDLPAVQENFMKVLQDGAANAEARLLGGKGTATPHYFTGIRLHVGPTPCMAGIGIDISERKLAEENLRASESSLTAAQARAHVGSWDLDLAALKGSWSAEMSRLHGRDPALDAPAYAEFLEMIHPEDRRIIYGVQARIPDATEPILHEYRTNPACGPVRHLSATVHVIRDSAGRAVQTAGTTLDITARKQAEEQLRALAAKIESARETESARIARELHDELGGALTALKMDVAWMSRQATDLAGPERAAPLRERAGVTTALIDSTIQSIRRICLELHPTVLDQLGLATAIEWLAKDFEQRTGIACALRRPASIPMDSARAITVYRIVQEILTNISRHANAGAIHIRLRNRGGHFFLRASDNGRGFSEHARGERTGLGLVGMRERAVAAGGRLRIISAPGRGTTVTLSVLSGEVTSG